MKLLLFLSTIILASCGKFSDGTSVWQQGLWLVPTLPFLGSFYFFYTAYKAHKSGSTMNKDYGGGEGGIIPIWKIPQFWFGVALILATIVIIIWVNAEK